MSAAVEFIYVHARGTLLGLYSVAAGRNPLAIMRRRVRRFDQTTSWEPSWEPYKERLPPTDNKGRAGPSPGHEHQVIGNHNEFGYNTIVSSMIIVLRRVMIAYNPRRESNLQFTINDSSICCTVRQR